MPKLHEGDLAETAVSPDLHLAFGERLRACHIEINAESGAIATVKAYATTRLRSPLTPASDR